MKKNITFIPSSKEVELVVSSPLPANKYLPEWYKNEKKFKGQRPLIDNGKATNIGIKSCLPFYDALTFGYIQETWCDIYIDFNRDTNYLNYSYSSNPEIIQIRDSPSLKIDNFYYTEFVWKTPWLPKLPNGYSALFTHPLNRHDLPFYVPSAVIDSDVFYHSSHGNVPFYIKENFSGIIPAGTPMFQIIPFKREAWEKNIEKFNYDLNLKRNYSLLKHFWASYQKYFHKKKIFN